MYFSLILNNRSKMFFVVCFVFSGTLMLQLDGFPTGDGVKVKAQLHTINNNNKSPVFTVLLREITRFSV